MKSLVSANFNIFLGSVGLTGKGDTFCFGFKGLNI